MSESIVIASIALGAVNAIGTIYSIWRHCKSDIEHRAKIEERIDRLDNLVTPLEKR